MITLTPVLARAAARDAANKQMRAAGRLAWSIEDYELAVKTFNQLCPQPAEEPESDMERDRRTR